MIIKEIFETKVPCQGEVETILFVFYMMDKKSKEVSRKIFVLSFTRDIRLFKDFVKENARAFTNINIRLHCGREVPAHDYKYKSLEIETIINQTLK